MIITNGYFLDPTSAKYTCPHCNQKSFVRAVNVDGAFLSENVGRCDHQNKCGYSYYPFEYFERNLIPIRNNDVTNDEKILEKFEKTEFFDIKPYWIERYKKFNYTEPVYTKNLSMYLYDLPEEYTKDFTIVNYFVKNIIEKFGVTSTQIKENCEKYNTFISLNRHPIDFDSTDKSEFIPSPEYMKNVYVDNMVQTPVNIIYFKFKVHFFFEEAYGGYPTCSTMVYKTDFHRSHENGKHEGNFSHHYFDAGRPYLKTGVRWCLYGEHLLKDTQGKNVIIVEAPKTAFVLSMVYPEFVWTATGGVHNLSKNYGFFNPRPKYFFISDSGMMTKQSTGEKTPISDVWVKRIPQTVFATSDHEVINLNDYCTADEIKEGIDILDLYLTNPELTNKIINNLKD